MVAAAAGTLAVIGSATAVAIAADTGPSTSTPPYVLPVADGVQTRSLLTVGEGATVDGRPMVGIPDGLGAVGNGTRRFELYMNHELRPAQGIRRRHGRTGAFVSKYTIDAPTGKVISDQDLIDPGVSFWDYPSRKYRRSVPSSGGPHPRKPGATFEAQLAEFNRFCSGTLTDRGQLHNPDTGRGFTGPIWFANEEGGDEGRVFGVTQNGRAAQLPRLGLFSWENTLPAFNNSDTTLVMGQEDTADGQLWAYVGTKRSKPRNDAFARAGLTNGTNFVFDAVDESVSTDAEFRAKLGKNTPAPVDLSEVDWDQSGADQSLEAAAEGLTLTRVEDGAWDPSNPNDFYFVTTEGGGTDPTPGTTTDRDGGGLWRLSYRDIEDPSKGATLTLLLDGSEAPYLNKPDNMDIDENGNLLIQEDPGGNAHVARIVAYEIFTGKRGVLAEFDRALFEPATPGEADAALTIDEESSGIIDASEQLGEGSFLFDAQVHGPPNPADPALVELGQLMTLHVDDFSKVYDIE